MPPNDAAETAKLVHMANQIAAFFAPYGAAEAKQGVRDHISAFWTPAMRRRLEQAPEGLDPVVAEAIGRK